MIKIELSLLLARLELPFHNKVINTNRFEFEISLGNSDHFKELTFIRAFSKDTNQIHKILKFQYLCNFFRHFLGVRSGLLIIDYFYRLEFDRVTLTH